FSSGARTRFQSATADAGKEEMVSSTSGTSAAILSVGALLQAAATVGRLLAAAGDPDATEHPNDSDSGPAGLGGGAAGTAGAGGRAGLGPVAGHRDRRRPGRVRGGPGFPEGLCPARYRGHHGKGGNRPGDRDVAAGPDREGLAPSAGAVLAVGDPSRRSGRGL